MTTKIEPTPFPNLDQFLGPELPLGKTSRSLHRFLQNDTASVGNIAHERWHTLAGSEVTVLVDAASKAKFVNPNSLLKTYEESIAQHVERRIWCFLMQAGDVYKLGHKFEIGSTLDQGQSSTRLVIREGSKFLICHAHHSAHSSTIPCLITRTKEGKVIPFLKDSDHYRFWNATMSLPQAVNDADREIDEKTINSELRLKALALINKASKGKVDPVQATCHFLDAAIKVIEQRLRAIPDKEANAPIRSVLAEYLEEFKAVKEDSKAPDYFERLLDMRLAEEHRGTTLEAKLREGTYSSIRHLQVVQSAARHHINKYRERIFKTLREQGLPVMNYSSVFNRLLLEQSPIAKHKTTMMKVLGLAPNHHITRGTEKARVALYTQVEVIIALAKDLAVNFEVVRVHEGTLKRRMLVQFRSWVGWNHAALSCKIYKVSPEIPASESTLYRTEKGYRSFPPSLVEAVSLVLKDYGVKSALFSPDYFLAP